MTDAAVVRADEPLEDNARRYDPAARGHVESYFLRANHPDRPLAIWLKATILGGRHRAAVAEVWCALFDGEQRRTWAAKSTVGLDESSFSGSDPTAPKIAIGDCSFRLTRGGGHALGELTRFNGGGHARWDLRFEPIDSPLARPLCLYPTRRMLEGPLPSSKLVTPAPALRFSGTIEWGGTTLHVDDWLGMQGHNWGRQHHHEYAWGQCLFCDANGVPLCEVEAGSGRIRIAGLTTPVLSTMVVRRGAREYRFDNFYQPWKQKVTVGDLRWVLRAESGDGDAELQMRMQPDTVVCLGYENPDGQLAYCLNSKIAEVSLRVRPVNEDAFTCSSEHGGAFELLRRTPDPRWPQPV